MTALPRWEVCATVKAPADQVLAFAAHYLSLGADRVWLCFDDPDDPAFAAVEGLRRIRAVRCDAAWWEKGGGQRPDTHQNRQMRNVGRVWRRSDADFVFHADADEYLIADRSVAECLADLDPERAILRVEPWEALHDPALPPDIFTARHFRRALPPQTAAAILGPYADVLPRGLLSHSAGKCFFRTGVPGLVPNIHGARMGGERVDGGRFHRDLALLHFHAEDPARWRAALPFRLTRGAYRFNPPLQAHLSAASAAGIDAFYTAVQVARPEYLAALAAAGCLRKADLGLAARVAALRARPRRVTPPSAPLAADRR
ncbi:MAG: glycosyltransferase family 2 protein [Gemmobacter sp.]